MTQNQADTGSQSIGIYLSNAVIDAGKLHAKERGQSFSSYVEMLIRADLETAGKLPGTPRADLHRQLDELIEAQGPEATEALLRSIVAAEAVPAEKEVAR